MMYAAFVALAVVSSAHGSQGSATYVNKVLGLAFEHPATWKVTEKKEDARIVIPLRDGGAQATLDIISVPFRESREHFQQVQSQMNQVLGRETLRQWEEEILGVPLLLTKTQERTSQGTVITLAGMLYAATPKKLTFRLTASAEDFEEAEFAFRSALQTLKTLNGTLPEAEDPTKPPPDPKAPPKTAVTPPKTVVLSGHAVKPNTLPRANLSLTLAGKAVTLRFPAEWKAESSGPAGAILTHPQFPGQVSVTCHSRLDSDPPGRALFSASLASLKAFDAVEAREEIRPRAASSGMIMAFVWRTGTSDGQPVASMDAFGATKDEYWQVRWMQKGQRVTAEQRKIVLSLLESLSLEPAP